MGKRGPAPEYGQPKDIKASGRVTKDCHEWAKSIGGPGLILETLFRNGQLKRQIEVVCRNKKRRQGVKD